MIIRIFKRTSAFICCLLLACSAPTTTDIHLHGAAFGTQYNINLPHAAAQLNQQQLQTDINTILADIDRSLSSYRDDSELMQFNRYQQTDWWPASNRLITVVAMAQAVSKLSEGALDITVAPLVHLWKFNQQGRADLPTPASITAVQAHIGYTKLDYRLSPPALRKLDPQLQLDVSALGEGYAIDELARYLHERGVTDYLIELGGEVRAAGLNPQHHSWRVAIERPIEESRSVQQVIQLQNTAIASSGDYRHYFELDGKRYAHILDSRSGWPAQHALTAVSVMATQTMWADALSTAFMVMGEEAAYVLAEREGIAAYFIIRQGTDFAVRYSRAFSAALLPQE